MQRWDSFGNYTYTYVLRSAVQRLSFAGRFSVGQNVYMTLSSGVAPNGQQDWKAAVQAWYDEVKDFSRNDITRFRSVTQQSCPCVAY